MVFLLDRIIEYLRDYPHDIETVIFTVGVCLFCVGIDLIFGAVVILKVFEYVGVLIDNYYYYD